MNLRKTIKNLHLLVITGTAVFLGMSAFAGNYVRLLDPATDPNPSDYSGTFMQNGIIGCTVSGGGAATWTCFTESKNVAGRFSLGTILGSEIDDLDDYSAITWGYPYGSEAYSYIAVNVLDSAASTSSTAIYGTDTVDSINADAAWVIAPYRTASGIASLSKWKHPGDETITVWMKVELLQDTWRYQFWFENNGDTAKSIALRWAALVQPVSAIENGFCPGGRMYAIAEGNLPWIVDHILTRPYIPAWLEVHRASSMPNPGLRLIMKPDDMHPDQTEMVELAVGSYGRIIQNLWNPTILPDAPVSGTGVGMKTIHKTLPATYHNNIIDPRDYTPDMVIYAMLPSGVSDVSDVANGLAVGTEAPVALNYDPDSEGLLNPNPFQIVGRVTNLYRKAEQDADLVDVRISLDLPSGFELDDSVPGNTAQRTISRINPSETQSVVWTVKANAGVQGQQTYQVLTSVPAPAISKAITGKINVSALNYYTVKPKWELISLPFEFDSNAFSSILSLDCASAWNGYRAYKWNEALETPWQALTTNPGQGRGFFMRLTSGTTEDPRTSTTSGDILCGANPPSGQLTDDYVVTLPYGWNIIGNPWLFPIPWRQIQFINPNNPTRVLTYDEAEQAGIIGSSIYEWNPDKILTDAYGNPVLDDNGVAVRGDYIQITSRGHMLEPFKGYFLRVRTTKPLQLIYPPVLISGAGQITTNSAQVGATSLNPTSGWKFNIQAKTKGLSASTVAFGTAATAKDKYDTLDIELLPQIENGVKMFFDNKWGVDAGKYRQDIRSLTSKRLTYDMVVNVNKGTSVNLEWVKPANLPSNARVTIVDKSRGSFRNMLTTNSYKFTSVGTHKFQVVVEFTGTTGQRKTGTRR